MNFVLALLFSVLLAVGVLHFGTGCQISTMKMPQVVNFQTHIRPILEMHCLECHNHINAPENANLNLETRRTALTTGDHAPVIIPGNGRQSVLYRVLAVDDTHPMFMPPTPDRPWQAQLDLIEKWIDQGAHWPAGPEGQLTRPQDWNNL